MKALPPVALLGIALAATACSATRPMPPAASAAPTASETATAPAPEVGSGTSVTPITASGTLAGGYLGRQLGPRLDDNARLAAARAEREALGSDSATRWRDDSGNITGEVQPLRSFTDAAGRECREYRQTIVARGRRESGAGIACRASDGSWGLVGG